MCGGFKPLYLPFRRKGVTSLSPPPTHRTLRVDGCRHSRTRRNKSHIGNQPGPGPPNMGEPMLLYIAATHQVVSAVLIVEQETDVHKFPLQKPVYYVSTVLTPCKSRYPHYQKIAYAVFVASRKLRHYFQECSIAVASEVPLNDIINKRDSTGRIAKWAIELLPFDIPISHGELLSRKFWPTSSPNGLKPNLLEICPRGNNKSIIIIFPCS